MIADYILQRYHIGAIEDYAALEGSQKAGEERMYRTFLLHTDYVPNKIVEAQALGIPLDQDYTEVLQARAYAREQLDLLTVQI